MSDTVNRLSDTTKVLKCARGWNGAARYVPFIQEQDEPGQVTPYVEISEDDWNDMGQPETITVTVRPGDLLNPGHGFVQAKAPDRVTVLPWCQTCGEHISQHTHRAVL